METGATMEKTEYCHSWILQIALHICSHLTDSMRSGMNPFQIYVEHNKIMTWNYV